VQDYDRFDDDVSAEANRVMEHRHQKGALQSGLPFSSKALQPDTVECSYNCFQPLAGTIAKVEFDKSTSVAAMNSPAVELDNHLPAPGTTAVGDATGPDDNANNLTRHEFSLPPADSGKDAWLFLAACWAVEALVWGRCSPSFLLGDMTGAHPVCYSLGFGFSFGVFQDYYSSHLPFKGAENIAVVGTTTLVSLSPSHQPALGKTRF
jgi:hypothetical protein